MNDVVLFRSEIDVEPDYLQAEYTLEVDLFFAFSHMERFESVYGDSVLHGLSSFQ